MKLKVKTFVEERVLLKPAGAAPGEYTVRRRTEPLEAQILAWQALAPLARVVSASAPGVVVCPLQGDGSQALQYVTLSVVYTEDS